MRLVLAAVMAISLAAPAAAETEEDQALVQLTTMSVYYAAVCDKAKDINIAQLREYGDRIGADMAGVLPALGAAMDLTAGKRFDRSLLIPWVTRAYRATLDRLIRDKNSCVALKEALTRLNTVQ